MKKIGDMCGAGKDKSATHRALQSSWIFCCCTAASRSCHICPVDSRDIALRSDSWSDSPHNALYMKILTKLRSAFLLPAKWRSYRPRYPHQYSRKLRLVLLSDPTSACRCARLIRIQDIIGDGGW